MAKKKSIGVHNLPGADMRMENVTIVGFEEAVRNEGDMTAAQSAFHAPSPGNKGGFVKSAARFMRDVSAATIAAVLGNTIKPS